MRWMTGLILAAAMGAQAYVVTNVTRAGDTVRFAVDNGRFLDVAPAFDKGVECCVYAAPGRGPRTLCMDPAIRLSGAFSVGSLTADPVVITGPAYSLEVFRSDFHLRFKAADRTVLYETNRGDGIWDSQTEAKVQGSAIPGRYYGIQSKDNQLYQWFGVGPVEKGDQGHAGGAFAWTNKGFGFFFDCPGGFLNVWDGTPMYRFDTGRNDGDMTRLFYLMAGTPREIMGMYHTITGPSQLPPLWALGFIHSEWGQNQTETMQSVHTYRDSAIARDGFTFDFEWMAWGQNNYGEFRWNATNFPWAMSGALRDTMDSYGLHMIGIRKPRIHVNTVQGQYCEANGLFDPDAYVTDYMTGQSCGQVDFGKPEAREWWWASFVDPSYDSYARGIRAYWNDEPGYGDNFLNLNWQRANYDGHRGHDTTRVFSLNRSWYSGCQRYAYGLWSGDISTGFDVMAAQRYTMLTSVTLGAAWWGMDIGGFNGHPSNENYFRWMQMGAFVPVYRVHCHSSEEREPWHFGQEAMTTSRDFITLRYRLLDYLYAAFHRNQAEGLPPVRPLVMDYPGVTAVENEGRAWMFGDVMLVSPIVASGATSGTFFLPSGQWYDFWDDTKVAGGQEVTRTTGRTRIPVMVKAGAVVPMRLAARYALDSAGLRVVTFHVYAGAPGSFTWYEDDYVTYSYEQGEYCEIDLTHTSAADQEQVVVGSRRGTFTPRQRSGEYVFHGLTFTPTVVARNWQAVTQVAPAAYAQAAAPAWTVDQGLVKVKVPDPFTPGPVVVSASLAAIRQSHVSPAVSLARGGELVVRFAAGQAEPCQVELLDLAGRTVWNAVLDPSVGLVRRLRPAEFVCGAGMYVWRVTAIGSVVTGIMPVTVR